MTDIQDTPAWRKAVEAAQTWFAAQFDGTYGVDADAAERLVSDILAALAESAEPLTEASPEFKAIEQAWLGSAHISTTDGLKAAVNAARAPLLAHIQALEAQREQIILAALGGEDAPGVAASLSVQDVEQACRDNMRAFYATSARADCAERQRDAAIEALQTAEWDLQGRCHLCGGHAHQGHTDNCPIGRVLAASQPTPEATKLETITCSKCGAKGVAFICDRSGCPVNGGMAHD